MAPGPLELVILAVYVAPFAFAFWLGRRYERRRLAPGAAPPRMACGRCAKPLSPAWRGECKHCRATFVDFPPVLRV